jgi:hypothetical protein
MSMIFKFSRGYAEYQAVQPIGVCCYSNTNSAEVLLQQQRAAAAAGSRAEYGPHA